uniref:Uncharacterized protein n=1 Tax=Globisporangium ultimum (strain ATCC 200006 / CBS 805.95 / DAOM BR144) TaxID=431595 RepID=K3WSN8_GLOUD
MAESAAPFSPSTTTRCARPDCISLREELELLRGDVQELAAENEHLHDTIVQRDAEAQTQHQESARHQEDFLETVAEKDREIERLAQVVHELTASLQQQQVTQRTTSGETKAPAQGASVNDGERGAQWEQECLVLRGKNAALEVKLVELRAKAQETASATHTMERMAQDANAKVSELYKVLKENELLRGEMRELEDALKRISEIAMEHEATVKVLYEHQNDYREAIDEQTIEITQLHTKIETLEQEKQLLEAKLIDMDERESDVEVLLKEAKMKSDMEKAVLRAELDELLKKLQQQQQQQKSIPPSSASASSAKRDDGHDIAAAEMEELEKQLERLQELRIKDKATIGELNQRIAQQQSDLESLVEHLDVDVATETAVQTAIASEQAKTATMRHDHVKLTRRLKEQQDVLRDMEFRQAQLEKELVDAQAWNAKYEQNAGLEDVMKFQKQLRKQLEKQQHANVTLRNQLNDQVDAVGKLHIAFDRLKVETGKPPSFEYDDLAIENHLKGELAVNQAVMSQMEHQIQELEAERVRLLQKLRDQARLTGHKLYETHGLTTEQWQVVEEFIDRVKRTPEVTKRLLFSGVGDHVAISDSSSPPQGDRKDAELLVKHEKELMTLYTEKMELVQEIDRLRDEVERSQTQTLVSQNAQEATITPKHSASKEAIKRMQEQIQQLQEEQEKQKRKREAGGRSFNDAKPDRAVDVSATARDSDDDVDSLSGDDEDAGDANEPPSERVEANSAAKQQNGTQTSPAKNNDQEGSSGATISRPASESPNPRTSSERNDWPTSAEGFAMAVAKALESRLAGLHQQQPPQTAIERHSPQDVPSPQQPKGKVAASKPSRVPTVDNVAFETEEEMTLLIDVMKELNVCLDELVKSEAQNEELQQQIAHHEDAFKALTDQHTILYQHFFHMHEEYTQSDTRLQRELVEMKHENHDLTLKCQRLESSLHLVQPADLSVVGVDSETRLRIEVLELTRKVAVYEVNEARFRRKYQQIHD